MSPLARIGSSTLDTCSRNASKRSKSAVVRSPSLSPSGARPSYQVANSTLPSRSPSAAGGRCRHISSAVYARIGAIQRTKASLMRYIADCALRRPCESSGIVYSRSLVTSRYSDPRSTLQKLPSACTTSAKS